MSKKYHVYALVTILCWSLAYVYTRMALIYISPYTLGFLRYLVATITMIIVCIALKLRSPNKKDTAWFILAGFTGFFLYMITFNTGSETISAATSSLIIATTPLITALLARVLYKERLKMLQYIAIGVSFFGVAVLTIMGKDVTTGIGLLYQLGSATLLSIYNLIQRKLTREYSSIRSSAFSIMAGTLMLCIFIPGTMEEIDKMPSELYIYILILGIFSSAIAYCSWSKAMSLAENTASVSNYMFLTPLFTAILGLWIADEDINSSTIVGGLIILVGLLLFSVDKHKNLC